tara:strand:+ start:178 stop:771 length:594 start_codon:yes stop_codon:yes gene_type:complete
MPFNNFDDFLNFIDNPEAKELLKKIYESPMVPEKSVHAGGKFNFECFANYIGLYKDALQAKYTLETISKIGCHSFLDISNNNMSFLSCLTDSQREFINKTFKENHQKSLLSSDKSNNINTIDMNKRIKEFEQENNEIILNNYKNTERLISHKELMNKMNRRIDVLEKKLSQSMLTSTIIFASGIIIGIVGSWRILSK